MISFVLFSITRAWQGFWRNAVMSLAATATMVLMLLLLAGFWIIQTGLLAGLQFTEQKVEVVAYLQPNATDTQVTALQKQLKLVGFDAYVVSAAGTDGQPNYRVRIGTFKSKAEAQRVAERVRGERSIAAFITPK